MFKNSGVKIYFLVFLFIYLFCISITDLVESNGDSGEIAANKLSDISFNEKQPLMVCIVIDRLGLNEFDIVKYENISILEKEGAAGLLNVRTADSLNSSSTYLSAGSGKKSKMSEKIEQSSRGGHGVYVENINEIKNINQNTDFRAEIGQIGKMAGEMGLEIGVLANNNLPGFKHGKILLMAMDENGFVPRAAAGAEIIKYDSSLPWGYSTNWDIVWEKYLEFSKKSDIIFIDSGDIARIDSLNYLLTEEEILYYKKQALKKIDKFLGRLLLRTDLSQTAVVIIVPTPPILEVKSGQKISWMLAAGQNIGRGCITSISTRRKGLITISDFLSFYKQLLTKEDFSLSENDVYIDSDTNSWKFINENLKKITFTSKIRPIFIKAFIFLQIFIIIVAVYFSFRRKLYFSIIINKIHEYLILSVLLLPLNFMFISAVGSFSTALSLLLILFFTVIECILLKILLKEKIERLICITTVMIVFISYDLFSGYNFLADTVLGYSSVIGARYYGIGNEYMGIYIGASLMFLSFVRQYLKEKKKMNLNSGFLEVYSFIFLIIITYFTGAAGLGANFGGAVTAVVCAFLWLFYNFDKRHAFISTVLLVTFILFMIYLDFSGMLGVSSHIGRAFQKVIERDFSQLWMIIVRKYRMNLKLLRWTIWSKILVVFIVYLTFLVKRPGPGIKEFFLEKKELKGGFYTCLSGSIMAMLVNDSGVVAAATILFFPLMGFIYLFPGRKNMDKL